MLVFEFLRTNSKIIILSWTDYKMQYFLSKINGFFDDFEDIQPNKLSLSISNTTFKY